MLYTHKKNVMPCSIFTFIKLLVLSQPLVTASESSSKDSSNKTAALQIDKPFEYKFPVLPRSLAALDIFKFNFDDDITLENQDSSLDQGPLNESKTMKEGDIDQILKETAGNSNIQEPVKQSNVDVSKADEDDLESLLKEYIQDSNNVLFELPSEEDKINVSLMKSGHSTMQPHPPPPLPLNKVSKSLLSSNKYQYYRSPMNKSTLNELQNSYIHKSVKSDPNSVPDIVNMNKDSPQTHQLNYLSNKIDSFNQVYGNQQNILEQAKYMKLPQLYNYPSIYRKYPHEHISNSHHVKRNEYNSLQVQPFLRKYDSVFNDLSNIGSNVQYTINPYNYWKNNSPDYTVINNIPVIPTVKPLQSFQQFQNYKYADREISERPNLQPYKNLKPYFSDDLFSKYEHYSYKPLKSEPHTDYADNKKHITDSLNGMFFQNQYPLDNYNGRYLPLDHRTYDYPTQGTYYQPINDNHHSSSYIEPTKYSFIINEDNQDIGEFKDNVLVESINSVHKVTTNEPIQIEVSKYSDNQRLVNMFQQQNNGIAPEVILNYIKVPKYQSSEPKSTYKYQKDNIKFQLSFSNLNKKVISKYPLHRINNDDRTELGKQSYLEEKLQNSTDDPHISYDWAFGDLVNGDNNDQSNVEQSSIEFENHKFINKLDEVVKPSLFLMKILQGALQQPDENKNAEVEQDYKMNSSQFADDTNKDTLQFIAGNELHRSKIDPIKTWNSPQISTHQSINSDCESTFNQIISTAASQLSFKKETNMDHEIDNIEDQGYYKCKSNSDLDPHLISINSTDGIMYSTGNTSDKNGPYMAVDYDSPERYETLWNPLDMPLDFSDYYIIFDLKASCTITKVYIINYGDIVHDVIAFTLEVWDDSNHWKKIRDFFHQAEMGACQEFGSFSGTGQYWKFTATNTAFGYQPWLVELGFHGWKDGAEVEQHYLSSVHVVSWVYYLVVLVVLGLSMLFITCLVLYYTKKRNGLYNITLVMGNNKGDPVTLAGNPCKDYTAYVLPAPSPASFHEVVLDNTVACVTDPNKDMANSGINMLKWIFNKLKNNNKST